MSDPIDLFSGMHLDADMLQRGESKDKAKLQEIGKRFETFMARLMLKEMRKASPDDGLFSSNEMRSFLDMLDNEIAGRITEGPGLGLAEHIERQLEAQSPEGQAAQRPVLGGIVTSRFGRRLHPLGTGHHHHKGLDIAAPEGTPIRPVRPGVVTHVGTLGGYGRVVFIDHGDGLETRYAHCESLKVQKGQRVSLTDVIATVGSTGQSTGPHLHLEVREDGEAVNPEEALNWADENPHTHT